MRALRRAHFSRMGYRLRPGLHHCFVDGRAIFLNLNNGRYFALSRQLSAAFERSASMTEEAGDVDRLVACGVLQRVENACGMALRSLPSASADRSAMCDDSRPSWILVAKAMMAQACAAVVIRILPLRIALDVLVRNPGSAGKKSKSQTGNGDLELRRIDEIAAAFRIAGLIFKFEGQCLPRTLAFAWVCGREHISVSVVIGVRINPFLAHCWCQQGATVLNDGLDTTFLFEPIFAV